MEEARRAQISFQVRIESAARQLREDLENHRLEAEHYAKQFRKGLDSPLMDTTSATKVARSQQELKTLVKASKIVKVPHEQVEKAIALGTHS